MAKLGFLLFLFSFTAQADDFWESGRLGRPIAVLYQNINDTQARTVAQLPMIRARFNVSSCLIYGATQVYPCTTVAAAAGGFTLKMAADDWYDLLHNELHWTSTSLKYKFESLLRAADLEGWLVGADGTFNNVARKIYSGDRQNTYLIQ